MCCDIHVTSGIKVSGKAANYTPGLVLVTRLVAAAGVVVSQAEGSRSREKGWGAAPEDTQGLARGAEPVKQQERVCGVRARRRWGAGVQATGCVLRFHRCRLSTCSPRGHVSSAGRTVERTLVWVLWGGKRGSRGRSLAGHSRENGKGERQNGR